MNVNGSGCSLGHPVAATGARMIATTIYELRRRGGGYAAVSMCAGGGMGSATVLEVLPALRRRAHVDIVAAQVEQVQRAYGVMAEQYIELFSRTPRCPRTTWP